jgi:hypothetical protein
VLADHGTTCKACGSFGAPQFGPLGKDLIHVQQAKLRELKYGDIADQRWTASPTSASTGRSPWEIWLISR